MRFILSVCREDPEPADHVRDRRREGADRAAPSTTSSGYGGARPVRIGNGAFDQRQNDVWGALLDSIYLHEKALRGTGTPADRQLIRHQVEAAIDAWPQPRPGDLGVARRARSTTSPRS